jgi:catechol 2,3-dioxygenase-like lactoylglutathione lyase family enzyme
MRRRTFSAVLAAGLWPASSISRAFFEETAPDENTAWVCPMHGDYTMDLPGKCPRCGMDLVHAAPFDVRDYELDFQTVPAAVKPGQKVKMFFRFRHPGTGEVVKKFEVVHERQFHLFVIGQDMEHFEHIHPVEQPDGTWTIETVLPKAGYYKVLSDFLPSGGSAQFLARPLVTAGYEGDLEAGSAHLVPDTNLTRTVEDITAKVTYDPQEFLVALYGHMTFFLTDTATGKPITDLQTYLGAFGHTLIMSEDMEDYVHSHPLDILAMPDDDGGPPQFLMPPGADLEKIRGGPEVTFEGLMPKPGRYRAWTQFRRNDKIRTFAYTFNVSAPV